MQRDRTSFTGLAVLVVAACCLGPAAGQDAPGTDATRPLDSEHFPTFPLIEPNVRFWTRVFSEWTVGQVAVHDVDHPHLVFDVVDLPGPREDAYTEEQKRFVESLREQWADRLTSLEQRVDHGAPLDDAEKSLVLRVATEAGTDALRGAADRVRTQRGLRERFRRGVEISSRYDEAIRAAFRTAGLPEDLAYLPHVESSFQAAARSSAGAVGVWQFTRSTGRRYLRINRTLDERLDPVLAAHAAAAYLKEAYARLGSWPLALTAYNHGVNGMARAVELHGRDYERVFLEYSGRSFGFASKNFYAEFLAARRIAVEAERHFPEGLRREPPVEQDRVELQTPTTPGGIGRVYGVPVAELASLNPAWTRRAVEAELHLPVGSTVWLPRGTLAARAMAASRGIDAGLYRVRPGDSLSAIAAAFGLTVERLRQLNEIPSGSSLIRVGQRLRVNDQATAAAVHVVRGGETLSEIAELHGISASELRQLNGMAQHASLIRVGEQLRVPGPASVDEHRVHVVRSGDTLLRIAVTYGVTLAELLLLNQLSETSIIYPGQRLRVPTLAR